jgi:tetratricopeptide (TPR) repeat protein
MLGKFVAPIRLSAFSTLDGLSVLAGLFAVAALGVTARGGRLRRGRILFGACWFFFFLAPTLIQRTGLYDYGEYRAYWLGFGVLVVLAELFRGFEVDFRRPLAMALAGVVLAGLGARALAYAPVFDGDLRFWSHMVAIDPESGWGWFHVGRAHVDRDELQAAERAFARAEAVDFPRVDLYVDWSALLLGLERFDEAEAKAVRGLEIDAANPYANFNLGLARMHTGRCPEAIPAFEAALAPTRRELLASVPGGPGVFLARAYHHLGGCHRVAGRAQAAALAWESALEADPDRFATYLRLVRLRIERGDLAAARELAAELRRRGGALTPSLQRKLAGPSS